MTHVRTSSISSSARGGDARESSDENERRLSTSSTPLLTSAFGAARNHLATSSGNHVDALEHEHAVDSNSGSRSDEEEGAGTMSASDIARLTPLERSLEEIGFGAYQKKLV